MNERIVGIVETKILADPLFYDEKILPKRRAFILFGRPGIGKHTSIKRALENAHSTYYDVTLSKFDMSVNQQLLQEIYRKPIKEDVLLIKDIGALVTAPATECVGWLSFVKNVLNKNPSLVIVCLSSRYRHPAMCSLFEQYFYEQFDEMLFVPAPNHMEREAYFKSRFESYTTLVKKHQEKINISIELDPDSDYDWMASCSAQCTFTDMKEWCDRIFYDIHCPERSRIVLDRSYLASNHILQTVGLDTIVAYDTYKVENEYRESASLGRIDDPRQCILKRASPEEEEEEERDSKRARFSDEF